LSVRAKHAEDAVTAAQKEAHDKVTARWDKARADETAAIQKVDRSIKSAGDDVRSAGDVAAKKWNALQTKVAGDLESLKSDIAQKSMIGMLGARTLKPIDLNGKQAWRSTMPSPRSSRQKQLF
jgi:hypothetical protein